MNETELLKRIMVDLKIFGGKPIVRGRRLAVERVLGMLAAGDNVEDLLRAYPWLEREDVLACLAFARRVVGHNNHLATSYLANPLNSASLTVSSEQS